MNKKTILQIFLTFLIFLIFLIFYLKYFNNKHKVLTNNSLEEKIVTSQNNTSTYIKNINYVSSDSKGNRYQVTAKHAEIKIKNSDEMFLKNVIAYIFIKDSETVKITSNFGKYNSNNYDSIFSKNVIVVYSGHKITGEYLDLSFIKNLGTISKDVIYNGDKTNLFADKIEMNLSTKDTKIFMNNANDEVLIESTN